MFRGSSIEVEIEVRCSVELLFDHKLGVSDGELSIL
jgi:hypothetical protein